MPFFTQSDVLFLDVMVLVMRQESSCRIEGKDYFSTIVAACFYTFVFVGFFLLLKHHFTYLNMSFCTHGGKANSK